MQESEEFAKNALSEVLSLLASLDQKNRRRVLDAAFVFYSLAPVANLLESEVPDEPE